MASNSESTTTNSAAGAVDLTPEVLRLALKELVIEECDKDIDSGEIADDEILIGGPMELDSLDALQICMAIKTRYGVRIEGGPEARKALESITTLADTIISELKEDS